MDIITRIIYQSMSSRLRKIERYGSDSLDIQNRQLKLILDRLNSSLYRQKYSDKEIKNYSEFSKVIPIVEYEDIRPWVEQMLRGKRGQLFTEKCQWFATSSGTSGGRSKYLPVPKSHLYRCHYQGASDTLWLYLSTRPDSQFFKHRSLVIGGSHSPSKFGKNTHTGDLSAILVQNMPLLGALYRVPSKKVLLMDEWISKMQRIVDEVSYKDVGSLSGVPSWMLEMIMAVLHNTGKNNLSDVWPNLEVFFHGGISFEPYREKYHTIIPSDRMQYRETYNASEGFFGIQDEPRDKSLLLMQDYGIFYEFLPMSQYVQPERSAVRLSDVQLGVNYALVLSTLGGLYRYIIGDTVQFTSLNPHKFIITGRTASYINAFGEELMVHNATEALSKVASEMGLVVLEYTAAPRFNLDAANGYHQWIIEFEEPPTDLSHFTKMLDEELRKLNSDYDAKRYADMALLLPQVIVARKGLFNDWLKDQGKLGGQHKIPRLKNDSSLLEQLIVLNNTAR